MLRTTCALTVAALAVLGVGMGTASASTVEVVPGSPDTLQITGAAAESSNLDVKVIGSDVRIQDVAGITAGPGCTPDPGFNPEVAFCPVGDLGALTADLGTGDDLFFSYVAYNGPPADPFAGNYTLNGDDGDDYLAAGTGAYQGGSGRDRMFVGTSSTVDGGADDDDIFSYGDNVLSGGMGDDTFINYTGSETIDGGGGDDSILDGASFAGTTTPGNDSFDGGPGFDSVSYGNRDAKVTANLKTGRAGQFKERDTLANVEGLYGGKNSDKLFGNDSDNLLYGGGGADKLLGFNGADTLIGGPDAGGRDILDAGPGDDTLNSVDGGKDDILRCKQGDDTATIDPNDRVGHDCEAVLP